MRELHINNTWGRYSERGRHHFIVGYLRDGLALRRAWHLPLLCLATWIIQSEVA
jgi:hypothetical protein